MTIFTLKKKLENTYKRWSTNSRRVGVLLPGGVLLPWRRRLSFSLLAAVRLTARAPHHTVYHAATSFHPIATTASEETVENDFNNGNGNFKNNIVHYMGKLRYTMN